MTLLFGTILVTPHFLAGGPLRIYVYHTRYLVAGIISVALVPIRLTSGAIDDEPLMKYNPSESSSFDQSDFGAAQ